MEARMLTDAVCRSATCPANKVRHRLADSGGLYLEIAASGSKRWFVKYRHQGKERRLAVGAYPRVSLREARKARDDARAVRESGADPVMARKIEKAAARYRGAASFEAVARELHTTRREGWSATYAEKWLRLMERDLFPWVGALPLPDVTAPVLLAALKRVEARGAVDSAHALRQYAGQVFKFGVATGRCDRNAAADLGGALRPLVVRHVGAVLTPVGVGQLMRDIDGYAGSPVVRAALAFSIYTFQRPGNVRAAEWAEFDLSTGMWLIPAAKMKRSKHGKLNGRPHAVPLAAQVVALLRDLQPLTGCAAYVFPSRLTNAEPMSENALRAALRRMGYENHEMTPHGARAVARTLIAENLPGISADVVEAQLAHAKSGPLGAAYDRAEFMQQRIEAMQGWADYVDQLRDGAQVIEMRA